MPGVILAGVIFVILALIFYTLFIYNEHKQQKATKAVLTFITIAILLDISATSCMMIGTTGTYFTFHGIVGYLGLLLMIVDAALLWKHKIEKGADVLFSKGLNLYSKIAYAFWLVAFSTGVLIALNK